MAVVTALGEVKKKVSERFGVEITFQDPDIKTSETITLVETSVLPAGLTLDGDPSISGNTVKQNIKDGVADQIYSLCFKVTISSGNVYLDYVNVTVGSD
jgi:hypothetical protein